MVARRTRRRIRGGIVVAPRDKESYRIQYFALLDTLLQMFPPTSEKLPVAKEYYETEWETATTESIIIDLMLNMCVVTINRIDIRCFNDKKQLNAKLATDLRTSYVEAKTTRTRTALATLLENVHKAAESFLSLKNEEEKLKPTAEAQFEDAIKIVRGVADNDTVNMYYEKIKSKIATFTFDDIMKATLNLYEIVKKKMNDPTISAMFTAAKKAFESGNNIDTINKIDELKKFIESKDESAVGGSRKKRTRRRIRGGENPVADAFEAKLKELLAVTAAEDTYGVKKYYRQIFTRLMRDVNPGSTNNPSFVELLRALNADIETKKPEAAARAAANAEARAAANAARADRAARVRRARHQEEPPHENL